MSVPKAAASDEPAPAGDVERYEQLRRAALAGAPGGSRLGLALLQRRGVSAWARAWQTTTPAPAARAAAAPAGAEELVGVLAAMALACITTRG